MHAHMTMADITHDINVALRYHKDEYIRHASYVTHLWNQGITPDPDTARAESKTAEAHRYVASELDKLAGGVQSYKVTVEGLYYLARDFKARDTSPYHENWQVFESAARHLRNLAHLEMPELLK